MIRVGTFTGEVPKLVPRYLPDTGAQIAYNVRLNDGALTPIKQARRDATLEAPAATIYRHGNIWLSWDKPVNVVPGPVAQDRLYITGDGAPKVRAGGETYDLALPPPTVKLTVAQQGTIDPALAVSVVYAYTYLTSLDEESEPCPLSDPVQWNAGMTNVLTGFNENPPTRVNRMRIYRSQTSSSGATSLNFIAERPYTVAPFVDNYGSNPIAEPIPSIDYNSPPAELSGIIALPNGGMAGFVGKRLYFCEPYKPHAWPEKYILTTDYPIVGLGAFGSSLVIATTGTPYVATGTAPENMTMEKLELNLPCISARGIVDLGYAVAYPSHEGLVSISSAGANVITGDTFSREKWLELGPESFIAGQYGGRYMATYAYADAAGEEQRGTLIIDTATALPFVIRTSDHAEAMFYEIGTGALYLLTNGVEVWEWDARAQPYGEMIWRSKPVVLMNYTNFGFIMIEAEDPASGPDIEALKARIAAARAKNRELMAEGLEGSIGAKVFAGLTFAGDRLVDVEEIEYRAVGVTVYADGVAVATIYDINRPVRLPGGFQARTWEFEVRGNLQVQGVALGFSPEELTQ